MDYSVIRAACHAAIPVVLILGTPARADEVSAEMSINASVQPACSLSASGIDFGTVNTLSPAGKTANGSMTVGCTAGTNWVVYADSGTGGSSSIFQRRMKLQGGAAGALGLSYQLYKDPAMALQFGNPTGGGQAITNADDSPSTKNGVPVIKTIYGKVTPSQNNVPAGTYTDRIILSLYII